MRKFGLLIIIATVILSCMGCGQDLHPDKPLITVERFYENTGVDKEAHPREEIEKLIRDYEITEENIKTLNIDNLLKDSKEIASAKDVSNLLMFKQKFQGDLNVPIKYVAYHATKGETQQITAFWDLDAGEMYASDEAYIFEDLSKAKTIQKLSESDKAMFLERLKTEYKVAEWEDNSMIPYIPFEETPDTICLIVIFEDGSGIYADTPPSGVDADDFEQFISLCVGHP